MERGWKPNVEICPPCPRCGSSNTKFCYYNNYSLTQPRYFCKGCRRYWTKGGSLRNIPVGGGCRKTRRARSVRISDTITSQNFLAHRDGGYGGRGNVDTHGSGGGGGGGGSSMGQQPSNIDLQQVYANFLNQRPQVNGDDNEQAHDHVLHGETDPMLPFGFPNMEMEFGGTNYGSNLEGFLNEGGHGMQFCGYNSIFGSNEEEQEKHDFFGTNGISNCGLPPLPGEELGWSESNIGFSENVLNPTRIDDQPEGNIDISGECSVKMFDLPDNSDTIFRP